MDGTEAVAVLTLKRKLNTLARDMFGTSELGKRANEDAVHLPIFQARLERARQAWTQFRKLWDTLDEVYVKAGESEKFPSDQDQLFYSAVTDEMDFSNGYAIIVKPSERQDTGLDVNASSLNQSASRHLPRITMPSFAGDLMGWKNFSDTFRSLVHNDPSLTNIEKFNYLKNSLKGEASTLIMSLEVTSETYGQAWKILEEAYDNPRVLASHYIRQALNYRPVASRSPLENYQLYLSGVVDNVEAFRNLNLQDSTDFLLAHISLRALDADTRKEFELTHLDIDLPSSDSVFRYIRNRIKALRLSSDASSPSLSPGPLSRWKNERTNFPNRGSKKYSSAFHTSSTRAASGNSDRSGCKKGGKQSSPAESRLPASQTCPFCQLDHPLYRCLKFAELTRQKRSDFVKAWKGCSNCLRSGHRVQECNSRFHCQYCRQRHHSLLHESSYTQNDNKPASASGSNFHAKHESSARSSKLVLFGTAQVIVRSLTGEVIVARAALDSCSQYTFVSKSLANRLRCDIRDEFEGGLTGLGDVPLNRPSGIVSCSIFGDDTEFPMDAVVVDAITTSMPSDPVPSNVIKGLCSQNLADPSFGRPSPIDILIGGDIYPQLLTGAPIKTAQPNIYYLPTVFGLVVTGCTEIKRLTNSRVMMTSDIGPRLDDMLKKFWELEEPAHCLRDNPEDSYCRQHFLENTSRDIEGRFTVKLPVRLDSEPCGNNRKLAARRFFNLEKRFMKDPEFKEHYVKFMEDYINLGHMSVASSPVDYVIPHHGIWQGGPHRKLRVVFDASCPSPSSLPGGRPLSLNDTLYTGPKVQPDISDILTRFRMYAVALTADIVKMYRQILVHQEQRKLQHIFWRSDPSMPLMEMELNTLTYGEGPCSFLAVSTVSKLAHENAETYALASSRVLTSMYVDDFVSGTDTIEEACQLKNELIQLFESGGFALGKWSSNVSSLVPNNENSQTPLPMSSSDDCTVKILGLVWDPRSDVFTFSVIPPEAEYTKRLLLSAIARVFDPLGLLAPVVFRAKCLIQDLWKKGLDWDDPLPPTLSVAWRCIADEWHSLERIKVPRHITWPQCTRSLIGFSDASERGYAAAVYLRSCRRGSVKVHLVKAKTKVAPTKFTSIARLELCGALLLARLVSSINIPECDTRSTRCFTDSMVVLAWLHSPTYKLNTSEANRVTAVLELTPLSCWRHVRTEENPSDLASRGCTPEQLVFSRSWWLGPQWVGRSVEDWPISTSEFSSAPVSVEVGKMLVTTSGKDTGGNSMLDFIERFSSLRILVRTVVRILRFARIKTFKDRTSLITAQEYNTALAKCVIITQRNLLPRNVCDPSVNRSPFKELSPFLDEDGVIRVGGRLREAPLSYSQRHPALLPQGARLSHLIITDVHTRNLHPGPSLTLALVRTNFWITGGLRTVKSIVTRCVHCRTHRARPLVPIMGDLPRERFSMSRAFDQTGVDFAGPFKVRESKRRKSPRKNEFLEKAYLCVFVCMASRAVHLECVASLSTVDFLAAFDRFIARRGSPRVIHSDNGSNFIGASRYLKDLFKFLKKNEAQIMSSLAPRGIEWRFIPPRAPHFGGSWEAAVKSVKALLTRSVGSQPFTSEELNTIFIRVEGLLNSRPLCPLSEDDNSWDFLTPGHFIAGGPTQPLPEAIDHRPTTTIARWKLVKRHIDHIWSRWRVEYLHHLQQRKKWNRPSGGLCVGDLVVLVEKRHVPGHWPVARVTQTHPGADSIVRVVSVQTPSGAIFKRSVTKLAPLFDPAPDDSDP